MKLIAVPVTEYGDVAEGVAVLPFHVPLEFLIETFENVKGPISIFFL